MILPNRDSADLVSSESTRIIAMGTMSGRSTCDLNDFQKWFEVPDLQPRPALPAFYGIGSKTEWESDRVKELMVEAFSINHLTKDDVPVCMFYSRPNTTANVETGSSEWVHHVKFGLKLQDAMKRVGLECVVKGPDVKTEGDSYGPREDFLIQKLND